MSERMTDERVREVDEGVTAAGWEGVLGFAAEIRADWLRARASEMEKDAQIKTLADALAAQRGHMGRHPFGCSVCYGVDAALRLAGRL